MSKRESIQRLNLIIGKVRKSPSTFNEINEYLEQESVLQGYNLTISKRTFDRDLEEIRSLYNIDIRYNYSTRVFEIVLDQPEVKERMLEAFDLFNALNLGQSLSGLIDFEKRKPQGTENLFGLLHAIRNQTPITFTYQKYWEEESSGRKLEPLAMKEFRNRWYLLGKDLNDNRIKIFALDRLTNLEIGKKRFSRPAGFQVAKFFQHCFGIIAPDEGQCVEEVILSFTPFQGKYIKSLPLHESQLILADNTDELRISLKIYITHDFLMEILSHGSEVKVIEPQSLVDETKRVYQNALGQY